MAHWGDGYLSSNQRYADGTPLGQLFTVLEGRYGARVLAFGFLYDFQEHSPGTMVARVQEVVLEPWFAAALTDNADVDAVAVLAHMVRPAAAAAATAALALAAAAAACRVLAAAAADGQVTGALQDYRDTLLEVLREAIRAVLPSTPLAILTGHSHIRAFARLDDHASMPPAIIAVLARAFLPLSVAM